MRKAISKNDRAGKDDRDSVCCCEMGFFLEDDSGKESEFRLLLLKLMIELNSCS